MRRWRETAAGASVAALLLLLALSFGLSGCIFAPKREPEPEPEQTERFVEIPEPAFPQAHMRCLGREINTLGACVSGSRPEGLCEALTPVGVDGTVEAVFGGGSIAAETVTCDVLDEAGTEVVASACKTTLSAEDGRIIATASVGEQLAEGREYLLRLTLRTEDGRQAQYFTRIRKGNLHLEEFFDFAGSFHEASFDKDEIQHFAKYLETEQAGDHSSFAEVNLKSNTTQISWGKMAARPAGEARYHLLQADGSFASIRIDYLVTAETEDGITRQLDAQDYFCLQYTSDRMYVMTYRRTVEEKFDPDRDISRKGINLGVTVADAVQELRSDNGQWVVFYTCGQLWEYDTLSGSARLVWSLLDSEGQRPRDQELTIDQVGDAGDVNFYLGGRMSCGVHEGIYGLSCLRYTEEDEAIREVFFCRSDMDGRAVDMSIRRFSGSDGDRRWFLLGNAIWTVDAATGSVEVLSDQISDEGLTVSDAGTAAAAALGDDPLRPSALKVWYLDEGVSREITAKKGKYLVAEGFIGDELIVTEGNLDEITQVEGEMLRPRTTLLALAKDGSEVSRIENPGVWYSRVAVEGANVYLEMVRQEDGSFVRAGSDVLVRSGQKPSQKSSDLTERTLDIRGKVQYINLNLAGSQPEITTKIANRIQECDQVSDIRGAKSADSWFAYAFGRLRGIYDSAGEAITAVSEDMGWVADREGRELWHRTAKKASTMDMDMEEAASAAAEQEGAKNHLPLAVCLNAIALHEDPQIERETIISADTSDIAGYFRGVLGRGTLDLSGCTVRQVMYFLGEGKPVLAINQDGSCLLLSGCDARNVLLTDPAEEHSGKMGQNDAEAWFAANGARFYAPR